MPIIDNQSSDLTIEKARQFGAAVEPLIRTLKEAINAFNLIAEFRVPDIQSSNLYAMAGRSYGNNTRGKKRWLLEMKHLSRF